MGSSLSTPAAAFYRRQVDEHRARDRGLVPVGRQAACTAAEHDTLAWAAKTLGFPRTIINGHLWTAPALAELLPALGHAGLIWPLHNTAEIAKMIGLDGLRAYNAAWKLDAPETDLGELLTALAEAYAAERAARRRRRRR